MSADSQAGPGYQAAIATLCARRALESASGLMSMDQFRLFLSDSGVLRLLEGVPRSSPWNILGASTPEGYLIALGEKVAGTGGTFLPHKFLEMIISPATTVHMAVRPPPRGMWIAVKRLL